MDRVAKLLADMHKKNINPPSTHIREAEVIGISPIRIRWGEGIVIENEKLIIPQFFQDGYEIPYTYKYMNMNGSLVEVTDSMKLKFDLSIGDKVTVAPDEHWMRWYIIDKVGD